MARVRQLKPRYEENARLRRLVGDFTLDQVMGARCAVKTVLQPSRTRPVVE